MTLPSIAIVFPLISVLAIVLPLGLNSRHDSQGDAQVLLLNLWNISYIGQPRTSAGGLRILRLISKGLLFTHFDGKEEALVRVIGSCNPDDPPWGADIPFHAAEKRW